MENRHYINDTIILLLNNGLVVKEDTVINTIPPFVEWLKNSKGIDFSKLRHIDFPELYKEFYILFISNY